MRSLKAGVKTSQRRPILLDDHQIHPSSPNQSFGIYFRQRNQTTIRICYLKKKQKTEVHHKNFGAETKAGLGSRANQFGAKNSRVVTFDGWSLASRILSDSNQPRNPTVGGCNRLGLRSALVY